jgi:N-acetylglucosamine kinase
LPLFSCGCGKIGCFEAYASGNGLAALGRFRKGDPVKAEEIVAEAMAGHAESSAILSEWAEIVAELLLLIQLAHDPDCIVLGGGLSSIPDVISLIETPFKSIRLGEMGLPVIRVAVNGDSSGARGAAIMAARIGN